MTAVRFFVLVALVVALCPVRAGAAAAGPSSSVQTLNQVVVVPPNFGVDGDYPADCQYVGAGSCLATLFAGGLIMSISWPPLISPPSCQNCATSVISYAIYRVPPGASVGSLAARPVFPASIQNVPNPTPTPFAAAHAIALPTPTPTPHITMQIPPQQFPSLASHVQVASGSWHPVSFIPHAYAIIPNVKIGDCFVARVIAPGNWQSADSNEVCINASTKFGTETVNFAPVNSYGFSFARNLQPACYQTYLEYSQPSSAGPVGWQPYSHAVPPSSEPCVGTQVLYSGFDFDIGKTQFPIEKAELVSGGAACVGEVDIGATNTGGGGGLLGGIYQVWTKQTRPRTASLDQDVTSMLNQLQPQFAFVFAPNLPPPPATVSGQCVSSLSGVTLKITRLR